MLRRPADTQTHAELKQKRMCMRGATVAPPRLGLAPLKPDAPHTPMSPPPMSRPRLTVAAAVLALVTTVSAYPSGPPGCSSCVPPPPGAQKHPLPCGALGGTGVACVLRLLGVTRRPFSRTEACPADWEGGAVEAEPRTA